MTDLRTTRHALLSASRLSCARAAVYVFEGLVAAGAFHTGIVVRRPADCFPAMAAIKGAGSMIREAEEFANAASKR